MDSLAKRGFGTTGAAIGQTKFAAICGGIAGVLLLVFGVGVIWSTIDKRRSRKRDKDMENQ